MRPETKEPHEHSKLEELTDNLKTYINTIYELNRLKAIDKLSTITGNATVYFILLILLLLILSLVSIGTAVWINTVMRSSFAGFFIVSGVYLLIAIVIFVIGGRAIKTTVADAIIKNILND